MRVMDQITRIFFIIGFNIYLLTILDLSMLISTLSGT